MTIPGGPRDRARRRRHGRARPRHRGHPHGRHRAGAGPAAGPAARGAPGHRRAGLRRARRRLEAEGRGFQLVEVAGGYRFQSHPDQAPYVERFVLEGQSARLSAAALETLAIVAYKQPISRAQIAAIRGVNVDGVVRTLEQRGYIEELARDPGPGLAVLYGTSRMFLERLGLASLEDLPPLGQFVPGADVVEQLEHGLRPEPPVVVEASVTILAPSARSTSATAPTPPTMPTTVSEDGPEKLQKVLARAGVASRRAVEILIMEGRVTRQRRGGRRRALGSTPMVDVLEVDGALVAADPTSSHYLLHKPAGVVTTASDPQGRPTVVDLVPAEPRVFPVGRLDLDTEGLLLLTNDGELTQRITHPSHGVEKEYLAEVEGEPSRGTLRRAPRGRRARRRAHRPGEGLAGRHRACCASPSTKGATARSGACARRSATRSPGSFGRASARSPTRRSSPASGAALDPEEVAALARPRWRRDRGDRRYSVSRRACRRPRRPSHPRRHLRRRRHPRRHHRAGHRAARRHGRAQRVRPRRRHQRLVHRHAGHPLDVPRRGRPPLRLGRRAAALRPGARRRRCAPRCIAGAGAPQHDPQPGRAAPRLPPPRQGAARRPPGVRERCGAILPPALAIEPLAGPLHAVVEVPGSKSITNRALVCAALAPGRSRLTGALQADDTEAMIGCLRSLGVPVEADWPILAVDGGGRLGESPVTLDAAHVGDDGPVRAPAARPGPHAGAAHRPPGAPGPSDGRVHRCHLVPRRGGRRARSARPPPGAGRRQGVDRRRRGRARRRRVVPVPLRAAAGRPGHGRRARRAPHHAARVASLRRHDLCGHGPAFGVPVAVDDAAAAVHGGAGRLPGGDDGRSSPTPPRRRTSSPPPPCSAAPCRSPASDGAACRATCASPRSWA